MTTPVRHEVADVSFWTVMGSGAALLVSSVLIYFLVWGLFLYFSRQADQHGSTVGRFTQELPQPLPPEPRLQTDPHGDLLRLRESEDHILNSYGWVDRNAGVVRIPIEQAMKLTVQRGLPSRAAGEPSAR
jgi:hypothetical protein